MSSIRRVAVGVALISALSSVALVTPAGAISPLPITCTAAGTVAAVDGGAIDTWLIAGKGSCQGDLEGTYFLDFTGTGTSSGLGLCDASLVVADLNLLITGTLTSFQGPSKPLLQNWSAPVTTYPLATPFVVNDSGGGVGAGNFFNHIFLNCQGSPVAQFEWAWLS